MKKVLWLLTALMVVFAFTMSVSAATKEEAFKQADDAFAQKNVAALKASMKALEGFIASDEAAAWRYARAAHEIGVNITSESEQDSTFKAGYKALEPFYKKGSSDINTNYWFALIAAKYANFHKFDAFKSGLTEEIKKAASKVVATNPAYENGNAHVVLGALYYKLYVTPLLKGGDLDKSIDNMKKGLKYSPGAIYPNLVIGQCYYEKEMYKEAKTYLEAALKGKVKNSDDRKYIAEAKEYLNKVNKELN